LRDFIEGNMRNPKVRQMLLVAGAVLGVLPGLASAQTYTIAQTPPVLATAMPPNVILTLDDSGSMQWAFVPDGMDSGLSGSASSLCPPSTTCSNTRRAKSATFNSLYYNPSIIYPAPLDALGNPLTSSFTSAAINGYSQGTYGPSSRGTVNLATQYRPTWQYNPGSSNNSSNPGNTGQTFANHPNVAADLTAIGAATTTTPGKAYYYVFSSSCNVATDLGNDNCYSIKIVGNQAGPADLNGDGVIDGKDEQQNFANWYSFYRTRNLMVVGGASRTFTALPDSARVAWQSLSTCTTFGTNCTGWTPPSVSNWIHAFDAGHRGDLYNWLFRLPASGSTPMRTAWKRAGTYYATRGDNSPYGFDPNQSPTVTGQPEYACRPDFHIAMTDGVWNSDSGAFCYNPATGTTVTCGNRDGTNTWLASGRLPDGTVYDTSSSLTKIHRDSNSDRTWRTRWFPSTRIGRVRPLSSTGTRATIRRTGSTWSTSRSASALQAH
jgi:type IV pilus assembly protein PilY1